MPGGCEKDWRIARLIALCVVKPPALRVTMLARSAPGFRLFQRVAVFPLEAVARGKIGLAVVVLPDLVIERLARLAAQGVFFEDVALLIAIQLDEPRLLQAVQAIGQNDQYFSLHKYYLQWTSTRSRLTDRKSTR